MKSRIIIVLFSILIGQSFGQTLIPIKQSTKSGFCNEAKKIIIPCIYDEVRPFSEEVAIVRVNENYGLVDKKGNVVLPIAYNNILCFPSGNYMIYSNKKYGIFGKDGKMLVPAIYNSVTDFSEGFAKVERENFVGFVNTSGKEVLDCSKFSYIDEFSDGLCAIKKGKFGDGLLGKEKGMGYINDKGEVVLFYNEEVNGYGQKIIDYNDIGRFGNGLARIDSFYYIPQTNGNKLKKIKHIKSGYINKKGELVIPMIYDYASDFSGGLAVVKKNDSYGVIDLQGKAVIPVQYSEVRICADNFIFVMDGNKCFLFNNKGQKVKELDCYNVDQFSEGLAVAKSLKTNKKGFIDLSGQFVISPKFDMASYFQSGFAKVEIRGKGHYINKSGEMFCSENEELPIGKQVWMNSDLDVNTFSNGEPIFEANTIEQFYEASKNQKPACFSYSFDLNYKTYYSRLYNWYAVNDPRGLAPKGWKIASQDDWKTLINETGPESTAGIALAKIGFYTKLFIEESSMQDIIDGSWWTSTPVDKDFSMGVQLFGALGGLVKVQGLANTYGLCVRCIKDDSPAKAVKNTEVKKKSKKK
ncbi:MAG: WG repeat-containing protein [Bacteroidota bacterium]|nr:WG repeat-containing protein [Bacteroidota bacterium]MDP4192236.1 WG repeat-containing protein [Bacteroidota bacterium]